MLTRSSIALVPTLLLAACAAPTEVGDATAASSSSSSSEVVSGANRYVGRFRSASGEDLSLTLDYRLDLAGARQELIATQVHTAPGVFDEVARCLSQTFVPTEVRILVQNDSGDTLISTARTVEASSADRRVPCPGAVANLEGTPHDASFEMAISFQGLLEDVDGHGVQIPSTSGYGATTSFIVPVQAHFAPNGRPRQTMQRNDEWVRESTLTWYGVTTLEMPRTLPIRIDADASATMAGSFQQIEERQQRITVWR